MEFEGIFSKAMSGQFFNIFGDIDDVDGIEGTFFDTDTASYTKYFRDITNLGGGDNLDAYFLGLIDGTVFFTLLLTSFRFALLRIDDGDPMFVIHFVRLLNKYV